MFLKLIAKGNLGSYNFYNFNMICLYGANGEMIPNLGHKNVISHTFVDRCGNSNLDNLFIDSDYVPYSSTLPDRAEIILDIPYKSISKIDMRAYSNAGGAKTVEIFWSNTLDEFTQKVCDIVFESPGQLVSVPCFVNLFRYLILKDGVYNTISENYLVPLDDQIITVDNIMANAFKDIKLVKNIDRDNVKLLAYSETGESNAGLLYTLKDSFKPIDKLDTKSTIEICKEIKL